MASPILIFLLFGAWHVYSCYGAPTTKVAKPVVDRINKTQEISPRCLLSLLGLDSSDDAPMLPDFGSPYQSGIGGVGLQGGVLANNNGFGSGVGGFGSPGLSSHYAPGLGQASNAVLHAQGMENQLYASQAQINSQLAGGIPLSPGFLRSNDGTVVAGLRSLPAPPTLIYM